MKNDKRKLFEAFEKVCGIKLIKENLNYEEVIKSYLLNKLSLNLDLEEGLNEVKEHEFEFTINDEKFTGVISMTVDVTCDNEPEGEYSPAYSDCHVYYIDINDLSIYNKFDELIDINLDKEFIRKLDKQLEVTLK